MLKVSIFTAVMLLAAGCSSKPAHIVEGGRSDTGEPALHAVHDQQLRELMSRMDILMQERFMTETQLDEERRKYALQIADSAASMSQTVNSIIGKLPSLALQSGEQVAFLALANKLKQQATQLQQLARQNQIDAIDDELHQINTTCSSCHALFRKLGN